MSQTPSHEHQVEWKPKRETDGFRLQRTSQCSLTNQPRVNSNARVRGYCNQKAAQPHCFHNGAAGGGFPTSLPRDGSIVFSRCSNSRPRVQSKALWACWLQAHVNQFEVPTSRGTGESATISSPQHVKGPSRLGQQLTEGSLKEHIATGWRA